MKTIVVGDLHGDFEALNHLIKTEQPTTILQVGDFGFAPKRHGWPPVDPPLINGETIIYWCEGNHDDISALTAPTQSNPIEVAPNCIFQPRGSTIRLPDGRRVLFYGGATQHDELTKVEKNPSWISSPHPRTGQNKQQDTEIDIIISHTAPRAFKLRKSPPPKGYAESPWLKKHHEGTRAILDDLLVHFQPPIWFFGHFHIFQSGIWENTQWTGLSMPQMGDECWWCMV